VDLELVSELVIVDQSREPFEIGAWRARLPVPLRLIHLQTSGLGVARNAALRQTDAPLVLFIDDDVIPEPALVREHVRTYREHPRALGVAGAEQLAPENRPGTLGRALRRLLVRWLASGHPDYLDANGQPAAIITRSGLFLCDFDHALPCRVMTPRGCNMSFRREALLAVGGFDERFAGPRRDESDLALRLAAAFPEAEIRYNPRARLLHLMSPTGGCRATPGRSYRERRIASELRFARRHLDARGLVLFSARLALVECAALLRHPGLLRLLWARDS